MLFGFAFVGVNNLIGFTYRDVKAAIKSSSLHLILIGVFLPWGGVFLGAFLSGQVKSMVVMSIVNWIFILLTPFTPF